MNKCWGTIHNVITFIIQFIYCKNSSWDRSQPVFQGNQTKEDRSYSVRLQSSKYGQRSEPVAVHSCPFWAQKTGLNQTWKHYTGLSCPLFLRQHPSWLCLCMHSSLPTPSRCRMVFIECSRPVIPPAICISPTFWKCATSVWRCSMSPLLWLHEWGQGGGGGGGGKGSSSNGKGRITSSMAGGVAVKMTRLTSGIQQHCRGLRQQQRFTARPDNCCCCHLPLILVSAWDIDRMWTVSSFLSYAWSTVPWQNHNESEVWH